MFNLPNPGSNPANPFYHRTLEEQRRALQEAVTVELQFKKDADGKKAGGKKVRDKVYKMTFKNDAEMNKFMDTNAKILDEGTEELDEAEVYKRPVKVSALGGQKFHAVVENGKIVAAGMTEKEARKMKKFGQQVRELPGAKVGQLVKEDVQLDEKKKPISTRLGDAFDSGELEDRIKSMSGPARKSFTNLANSLVDFYHSMGDIHQVDGRQLEDKIDASPPRVRKMIAKLLDESRDDFDYLDVEAARQDAKLEAPKVVKTRNGFQVMVYSRKVRKHIPQGQPHKTKAAAEKDAKMFEDVQLDESMLPAYDARLLRQALVLGKNAFKAGKKREPIKDPNLVKLKGFAKGKGKNEVMKQWLKGWDEMNLKDDVQIDEASKMGLKKLSQGARTILASAINMSMDGVPGMDSAAANEKNLGKFSEADYDKAIKYLRKSFSKGLLPKGQQYAKEVIKVMEESVELDEMIRAKDKYPEIDKIKKVMMKKGVGFYTKAGKIMVNPANVSAARDALNKAFGGQFEKKTNMEVKADKRQSVSGGARIKENVELDEMSAKQHYNKMVAQGKVGRGGRVVTPIDRDRFPNREKEGLEGPFRSRKSGQVYYYDKKAGKYYDPLSDMFLQVKDVMEAVNEEVNLLKEEVKTMDQKKAKQVYDKLKKGSEIEVDFGNMISMGGRAITLRVTSGNRIVGASRVGRIILVNPENPRGMKYKLFNRDGKISLAQGDMGTILKDMKIVKEDVEQVEDNVSITPIKLDEKEFKAHKMYHPETGVEVEAKTRADHLRFSKMGYKHDKPTK